MDRHCTLHDIRIQFAGNEYRINKNGEALLDNLENFNIETFITIPLYYCLFCHRKGSWKEIKDHLS